MKLRDFLIEMIDLGIAKLMYGNSHPVGYSKTKMFLAYKKNNRYVGRGRLSGSLPRDFQSDNGNISTVSTGFPVISTGFPPISTDFHAISSDFHSEAPTLPFITNETTTKNSEKSKTRNDELNDDKKRHLVRYVRGLQQFFAQNIDGESRLVNWNSTPMFITLRVLIDAKFIPLVLTNKMKSLMLAALNKKTININQSGAFIDIQIPFGEKMGDLLFSDSDYSGLDIGYGSDGNTIKIDIFDNNINEGRDENCNLLIIAKPGGGKSNIAKVIIMRLSEKYGSVGKILFYISDLHGDYLELNGAPGIVNNLYYDDTGDSVDTRQELADAAYITLKAAHDEYKSRTRRKNNVLTLVFIEEVLELLSDTNDNFTDEQREEMLGWVDDLATGGRKMNVFPVVLGQKGNLDDIPHRASFTHMIYGAIDPAGQPTTGIPKAEIDLSALNGNGDMVMKSGMSDVVRFQALYASPECISNFMNTHNTNYANVSSTNNDTLDALREGIVEARKSLGAGAVFNQVDPNFDDGKPVSVLTMEIVKLYTDSDESARSVSEKYNHNGTVRIRAGKIAKYLSANPNEVNFIKENISNFKAIEARINEMSSLNRKGNEV